MKKLLCMFAASAMSSALIVGVAMLHQNQNGVNEASFGGALRYSKIPAREQGAAIAGNAFYVNLKAVSNWWFSDGYTTYAYFYHNAGSGVSEEKTWVTGFSAVPGDADVYEITVPGGYTEGHPWTNVIVCRANGASFESVVNEGQTGDMVVNSSGQNGVTIQNSTWWDDGAKKNKRSAAEFSYSAETRILKWIDASGSGSWTNSGVCAAGGTTVREDLEKAWKDSGDAFKAIAGNDVKSYFSNLDANESGSTAQNIAARYDHILVAHSSWTLENFASR